MFKIVIGGIMKLTIRNSVFETNSSSSHSFTISKSEEIKEMQKKI